MEDEFIYWPHPTPVGIRVEEVSGMECKSGALWREMAMQIFCENGRDGYCEIGHFPNGAPFFFGLTARVSVTHTGHLLAVATLPKTPEADLSRFNTRTALGIDAERLDRRQVLKVRDKFLSDTEKNIVAEDDLEANIIAWTAKEALYKAALSEGLDFRNAIVIESLPQIDRKMNLPGAPAPVIGKAKIFLPSPADADNAKSPLPSPADADNAREPLPSPADADNTKSPLPSPADADNAAANNKTQAFDMELYSYESDGCCVTLAYSPKCAKFSRR